MKISFKNDVSYIHLLVFYLFLPIISFIIGQFHFYKKWFHKIVLLLCVFFGITFVVPNDEVDSFFYKEEFKTFVSFNIDDFLNYIFIINIKTDFVGPVLSFTVSRFSSNPTSLFILYSIVFGFFLSQIYKKVVYNSVIYRSLFFYIALVALLSVNGIWNINGFRFWCAFNIYVFCVISYYYSRRNKFLCLLLLIPFLHFSFLLPMALFYCYNFLLYKYSFYKLLWWLALCLMFFDVVGLNDFLIKMFDYLPDFLSSRSVYLEDSYISSINEQKESIAIIIHSIVIKIFTLVVLYVLVNNVKPRQRNLLGFVLWTYPIFIVLSSLPSFGRFLSVSHIFSIVLMINYSSLFTTKLKYILSVLLLLYIIGIIRINFFLIGNSFFYSNVIIELIDKFFM